MLRYLFFGGLFIIIFAACRETRYYFTEGSVYGTTYHISYESKQDYAVEIREEMERVNRSLSMFNPNSVLSRWNKGETEKVDSLFLRMWAKAWEVYTVTDGAFDITVAPLVNAWGFGLEKKQLPSREKLDSLLLMVGMNKVLLDSDKLIKSVDGIQLDASSIAKGLGVDLVAEFFNHRGIKNYMIEIGGEIRLNGLSDKGRAWHIGIDKPIDDSTATNRELQLVLEMTEGALATSGNYRRYYVIDGKKYAHTINPKTGNPVQRDIIGSSVYASTCMEADAYATAFMVLGFEEAKRIVQELPGLEACLIHLNVQGEKEVWMSEGIKKRVLK